MQIKNTLAAMMFRLLRLFVVIPVIFTGISSCGNQSSEKKAKENTGILADLFENNNDADDSKAVFSLLVSPKYPRPGQPFRVLATGGKNIGKATITVNGSSGSEESKKIRSGDGLPCWRIDEFVAGVSGNYQVTLKANKSADITLKFSVTTAPMVQSSGVVWKTVREWNGETEALYSAWINALYYSADERSSWGALHEVTQNRENNFLHNYLSLGEDDAAGKTRVLMEPDCADNPFYLRAYFAWKLGLPFGYHECDRGFLGRAPKTGRWITNESAGSKSHPVLAFNSFVRMVMNGVHSGTARTALKDESSDYYPVPLTRDALRPGVIFADPYGHTLIIVRWIPQTDKSPGVLLSVDAQPDGTVAIKRFWKGNFLFATSEVIGDPGFKALRPIVQKGDRAYLLKNDELIEKTGLIPFSLEQQGMTGDLFYQKMERVINPKPLDPEMALLDLVQALHEQLLVRIISVSTGEDYMKVHPGLVIPMPGGTSGVFQSGGQWEDFSTPNRDLRLLIAMDAVADFPNKITRSPEDFKMSKLSSPGQVKKKLEELLSKKLSELSITYVRTNGSKQTLTMGEILKRKEAFEMAYNPNDGVEIRWGAPQNSEERSTCVRHVPASQAEKMQSVRKWFQKRLHPPT